MKEEDVNPKSKEKMEKIDAFLKSLQVGFQAKLISTEDGIRPVVVMQDNEKYEDIAVETPVVEADIVAGDIEKVA